MARERRHTGPRGQVNKGVISVFSITIRFVSLRLRLVRPFTHNYSLDLSDPFKRRPDNICACSSSVSTCLHGAHDQFFLTCSYRCQQDHEPRSSSRCRPMSKARRKVILTFSPTAVFSTIHLETGSMMPLAVASSIQSPIVPDPPLSPPLRDADLSCVRIC